MHKTFNKSSYNFPLPDLTQVQKDSYKWLFKEGISEILEEMSPLEDRTGRNWEMTFNNPRLDKPELTYKEAQEKGVTYSTPWYLTIKLSKKGTKEFKEVDQYMGDIPLMTPKGSFIINGVEKVVISQLTRSYGVLFVDEVEKTTGRLIPKVKILPKYGAWIELDVSKGNVLNVKIDKRRKFPLTTLLRVFGLETDEQIKEAFADVDTGDISLIQKTLEKDPTNSFNEAVLDIYTRMRPGEPEILENAKNLVETTLFDPKRYNLGVVGRFKLNQSLNLDSSVNKSKTLSKEDLVSIVKRTIQLVNGVGDYDVVDDLSNRRVKGVGELLQQQIRIGFVQMERNIRERMSLQPRDKLPEISTLVSTRPVAARIQSFFASGQLTQYPEQYNALTTLNLLRRLSVLGPGGLTRERASYSVRDVHHSQYGKICPIHTPEGPSVGLLTYMALYTRINEYGFLESPYRKVEKDSSGKVRLTEEVIYLAAYDEKNYNITDASVNTDEKGYITDERVPIRKAGEFRLGTVSEVDYADVVPNQILGLVSGLIPFVANNDPTRSAMACQQVTQAVPLVAPEAPLVGTGLEFAAADNAYCTIRSDIQGEVSYVDSRKVVVKGKSKAEEVTYNLDIYKQSNSDTAVHFRPVVNLGDKVKKNQLLAESMNSVGGRLALGTNLKVAYMIWDGLNYDDSIVISQRLVKEDVLTSVSIKDYTISVQETKLGPEEVTRDIPNVPEHHLRNLDESGVVTIGSRVQSGDILVGMVQPRGEVDLSAEERLLRAIFGEKAKDVKDVSLRVPHGVSGVVIGVKEFSRKEKDELPTGVLKEITVYIASLKKIGIGDKLSNRYANKGVISKIVPVEDMPHTEDGQPIDIIISATSVVGRMNVGQLLETSLGWVAEKNDTSYDIPSFTKFDDKDLETLLKQAGLPVSGKTILVDGRTGEKYSLPVLVGNQYVLKLHHMSESKMHSRSTGPYSLITQQPLGGKAQNGGQRFGEMEVWALEAYGAAHTLQEMLTIKSDDIDARNEAYRSILKGEKIPQPTMPESFKLLVRELNGLGLTLESIKNTASVKVAKAVDEPEDTTATSKAKDSKEGEQSSTKEEE